MGEFLIHFVISNQPAYEKTCCWVAHWVVSLPEAKKVDFIPYNVDIWEMPTENYGPKCKELTTIGNYLLVYVGKVRINLPSESHWPDWKDNELVSQASSNRFGAENIGSSELSINCS